MKLKRILSLLIALTMIFSCVGLSAMAEETGTVAKIGSTTYTSFDEAITAANKMSGDVTVEIYGKVEYTDSTANLIGSYDSISFVGKTADAEISLTRNGSNGYIGRNSTNVDISFTDLILSKPAGKNVYDAECMNTAFTVYIAKSVTYTNCTFPNGACASGCETTYKECTFQKSHDKYALWTYGDNTVVVVNKCVFDDDRGIKLWSYATGDARTALTVTNCDFSKLTGKPAIVLTNGKSVNLEGNSYSSTGVFELEDNGSSNGIVVTSEDEITCVSDAYPDGCGVLVDGKIYTTVAQAAAVATANSNVTLLYNSTETVEFAEGVVLNKNGFKAEGVTVKVNAVAKIGDVTYSDLYTAMTSAKAGETVELLSDVDLSGTEWEPVSFAGKFNGNGFKIKNLTINKPGVSNTGFIASLNGSFENVTFENPTVKGGECTGVLAGRAGGSAAYAKDINVTGTIKVETTHSGYARAGVIVGGWAYGKYENITVDGIDKAISYIKHTGGGDGRYVAGIVGHADEVDAYINCSVKNITISGGWLCGGIAGPGPSDGITTGCTVENIDMGADYSGGMFGWYYGAGTIENSTIKEVTFTDGSTNNGAIGGYSNNDDAVISNVVIENVKNASGAPLLSDAIEVKCADGTVEYYDDMADAVRDDQISYLEGATIKLLKDYTGKGIRFLKPGMVLDLNGFTYTVNSGEGSNGSKTSCFQVKADSGNTLSIVKNGTIKIAPKEERGAEPNIYWVFNSYTGLNIENVTIDCTNLDDYNDGLYSFVVYTGNGKTTNLTGTTSIINYTNGGYSIANRGETSVTNIDTTGKIEGLLDTEGNTIVKNGIFTNNVSQFCEAGYVTVKNADGFYAVAKTPNAEVSVLEPMTLDPGYIIWPSGDNSIKRPLEIVMNFKTNETTEEARPNGFLDWKVDFYLEFEGLTNKTITADNCYLAGKYGTIGWVVIPTDGLTLDEGVEYPVVAEYDANITYKQVCDTVKDFTAAIHVDQAILDANPNFKVKLSLKMTNPNDANDVLTIGEPAVYTAEDLKNKEEQLSGLYVLRNTTAINRPGYETKYYRVRVYSAIDSLDYKEVGFCYRVSGNEKYTMGGTKDVYTSRKVTNTSTGETETLTPQYIAPGFGNYIFAYNIWANPEIFAESTSIDVRPYAIKKDDTVIYLSDWKTVEGLTKKK